MSANRSQATDGNHGRVHSDVPGGGPVSTEDKVLETGAGLVQDFGPLKNVCAHLNGIHAYADEPGRFQETDHYCAHVSADVRQCLLYDGPGKNAKVIGIEYLITEELFKTLDPEERKLWHSHVYEIKSGMLVMPSPVTSIPCAAQAWETAETEEMKKLITWYGKIYQLWQVDRDTLPLGQPKLMTSFTEDGQFADFEKHVGARDQKFGTDWRKKMELRKDIPEPEVHPDADQTWK